MFISYRTVDESVTASLLFELLTRRFGPDTVFRDSDSLRLGEDFEARLLAAVRGCAVLLVVVGRKWLDAADGCGRQLIRCPTDWVHREIVEALRHGVHVVPVLVGDAAPLTKDDLPDDIAVIVRHQFARIRHRHERGDVAALIDGLLTAAPRLRRGENLAKARPVPEHGSQGRSWWRRPPARRGVRAVALAVVTLLVVGAVGWWIARDVDRRLDGDRELMGEPRTADPCALASTASLAGFGVTKLEADFGTFDRCDVILDPSDSVRVGTKVQLAGMTEMPAGAERTILGDITRIRHAEEPGRCQRSLLLPGRRAVLIVSTIDKGRSYDRLCDVAEAATDHALGVLERGEIPRRPTPEARSLALLDACTLIDPASLTPVVGAVAPGVDFANWGCTWYPPGARVSVRFERYGGRIEEMGRVIRIGNRDAATDKDENDCLVAVVHRSYVDRDGWPARELVLVEVAVSGPVTSDLCATAVTLATAAVNGLPA